MGAQAFDIAIVGAGAAGMRAAVVARKAGASVVVLDEQAAPGGQMYRAITQTPVRRREVLGLDYWHGATIAQAFAAAGTTYLPGTTVWAIGARDDGSFEIAASAGRYSVRQAATFVAQALILAPGAIERPFPVRDWTLPGVMTVGAAQTLLKASGLRVAGRTVFAGIGPLLWITAWQHLNAGGSIDLMLETIPRGRLAEAMRHAPGFMFSGYLAKGLELVRRVRRKVRFVEHVESIVAEGDGRLEAVRFASPAGEETVPADLLLLHQGIVPNVHLVSAVGCDLAWNEVQAAFVPVVDDWGGSTLPRVFVTGDAAGIAGAVAAEARGELAALAALNALGRIGGDRRDEAAKPARAKLAHAMRGRAFLDALYRPPDAFRLPADDVVVCRCEEVTAGDVRAAARAGAATPGRAKAWTRCGMGPCQGRQCALTLTELVAQARGLSPREVGYLRSRFPAKPVTLAELAAWPAREDAERAVNRDEG